MIGLLVFVPAYYFEENNGLIDKLATAAIFFLIISVFLYLFVSASVVLFSWTPIVKIGADKIFLPLIGLVISRDEVLDAAGQSSKVSEHWRVSIKLKTAKHRMLWAWLLFPTAYAVGDRIYIFPLVLGPQPDVIQRRIVDALSAPPEDGPTRRGARPTLSNG